MTVTCKLKSCGGEVNKDTGKVEVRGFQISSKERENLKVSWNADGEAVFHPKCWAILRRAVKSSVKNEIGLSELEIKLISDANKTAEYHDPDPFIKTEADKIVKMLRMSDYCIAFTGAGISTAAGIGDFRGKDGKWTEREKLKQHGAKGAKASGSRGYTIGSLRPTYTHEALEKLLDLGLLKFIISQNTDGLHRLSGVPESKISELHGNAFIQRCEKCEARYDFPRGHRAYSKTDVPPKKCARCNINHRTGRVCERKGCGGYLMNTIINFGDYLEDQVLTKATENAKKADFVLCLGSTLQVSPANSLVEMGKQPMRLVICNRQGTPYDSVCKEEGEGSRIFGDCDRLMTEVMRGVLGNDGLQEWEEGRDSRMAKYDERRQ